MIAYAYLKSTTKEYLGIPQDIQELTPEFTLVPPPAYTPGVNIPIFDDVLNTWTLTPDLRGTKYLNILDNTIDFISEIDTLVPANATTNFDENEFNEISGESQKNILLDSDFKFWSEGLSNSPTTYAYVSGGFAGERENATTGIEFSRQAGFDNSRYSMRIQRNAGDSSVDAVRIGQILSIDEAIHYGDKDMTLSFTLRKGSDFSALNSIVTTKIISSDTTENEGGNLGNFSVGNTLDSKNHTIINNEFRYRHFVKLPINTKQIKVVIEFTPDSTALANDYIEITNVKLEQSSVATPYIADSLAVAQDKLDEYYITTYDNAVKKGTITNIGVHSFHAHGNITADIVILENIRYNFPRPPVAEIYNPATGDIDSLQVTSSSNVSTNVVASMSNTSTKNSSVTYNNAITLPNESVATFHYVLDARL